jgi:hypothetical protein
VRPAEKLGSPSEADFFAACLKEIDVFCERCNYVEYDSIYAKIDSYLNAMPAPLHQLFSNSIARLLSFHYLWKMLNKSDFHRIMKELKSKGFKETSLSDLTYNNECYQKLTSSYHDKIKTATKFVDAKTFLQDEMNRVENEFINPVKILQSNNPTREIFNYSRYCKFAFNHLMRGEDWLLRQVVDNAIKEYSSINQTEPPDLKQFEKNVTENASRGVGYLMYSRYLKENRLNMESTDTIYSIKELAGFLEETKRIEFNKFVSGLKTLEKYIVKNVYEVNGKDLSRLQQLERNLTRWLFQLDAVYIETVGDCLDFDSEENNTKKNENLQNLKKTLTKGLAYLKLQINGKKENNVGEIKTKNRKKRTFISSKIRALLQKEIHSKCPFCNNEDVDHFEIHHIDDNPSSNCLSNLLMLCPTCHSKVTKKDISLEQVIRRKRQLQKLKVDLLEKVEIDSSFPGGQKAWQLFLSENLQYPSHAVKSQVQGTVVVVFVVSKYGEVEDVKAVSGPTELFDAAEAIVKISPRWHAAVQNGINVKTNKRQPIVFSL